MPSDPSTLWSAGPDPDRRILDQTSAEDRPWDARLMRWDVLGSLGHVEGLRASGLLGTRDHARLRRGLRQALVAVERGRLALGPAHEDVHTAVEHWLTRRYPGSGERLHTGRSRNDQVAVDLRLYLKDRLLTLHALGLSLAGALLDFARRHQAVLWPGYTHQRRAMPSSAGLWAGAYAEGLLDTLEAIDPLWRQVDRSPLGSAAGYGVPLPLRRERTARALGFGGLDRNVAAVQGGRGKLEAAALFWCTQLGHEMARLSQDVILYTAEEFGYLVLPPALATGSSIMPHKRNPDLFELTRGRAGALEGDLLAVLQVKGKLSSGYHRDFQLLKEPLMRGLDRTALMLETLAGAVPLLGVDRARGTAALDGGALATDEVMRRVEEGTPFRLAYREVKEALGRGGRFVPPSPARIVARRCSTGGVGNLGLAEARGRVRRAGAWNARQRRRFALALRTLAGRAPPPAGRGRPRSP
ncbi:MAG TPA: lyase family protein [Gemmatimonadales bacterium]|nr:lyase family protein [Gemmatimonadales bacterium]